MATLFVRFADTRCAWRVTDEMTNTAHCCDTYKNFAGVQILVLANQVIPFYIVSPPHIQNRTDAMGDFKNYRWGCVPKFGPNL
jgi:hypothetical protein